MLPRASRPFRFYTQADLTLVTGLRARNLKEFATHLKSVPESVIYYHTHRFLQQHQYLTPEPPNDFAFWITNTLQNERLGEEIAAIDTIQYNSLEELRQAFLKKVNKFLSGSTEQREVPEERAFHFMRSVRFRLPTQMEVYDLREFADALTKASLSSLYFHIYEARLRPPEGINDFSRWLQEELHEKVLAKKLAELDPYTQTMEGLRQRILGFVRKRIKELKELEHAPA